MLILDTDTLTHNLYGQPLVSSRVAAAGADVAITIVSRIEVLRGRFDSVLKAADARHILLAQEWLAKMERLLSPRTLVPLDEAAVREFDGLRSVKGLRKIGRADLLIAYIALAHNATLVTRNRRHFGVVPGLRVENWAD